LTLAVVVALGLVVGSGSFTATDADRDVSVAVADDASAYVALTNPGADGTSGDTVTLYTVTNNLPTSVEVDVDVTQTPAGLELTGQSDPHLFTLGTTAPEDSEDLTASIACDSSVSGTVGLALTVTGDDVEVDIDREVAVECDSKNASGGTGPQNGGDACENGGNDNESGGKGEGNGNDDTNGKQKGEDNGNDDANGCRDDAKSDRSGGTA
jgi:hypothetical protein